MAGPIEYSTQGKSRAKDQHRTRRDPLFRGEAPRSVDAEIEIAHVDFVSISSEKQMRAISVEIVSASETSITENPYQRRTARHVKEIIILWMERMKKKPTPPSNRPDRARDEVDKKPWPRWLAESLCLLPIKEASAMVSTVKCNEPPCGDPNQLVIMARKFNRTWFVWVDSNELMLVFSHTIGHESNHV